MKILVGIDRDLRYRPALAFLSRLRFREADITLAHAVDSPSRAAVFGIAEAAFGGEIGGAAFAAAEAVTGEALECALALGLQAETSVLAGPAASALMEFAAREQSDLIVIHSVRKSALDSLFLGSVARALAIGSGQSVLISKGKPKERGPVTAVFATDHSPYACAALDHLIDLKPQGIEQVHLVSAAWMRDFEPEITHFDNSDDEGPTQAWLETHLAERNAAAAAMLSQAGFRTTTSVDPAKPVEAIRKAMDRHDADLLIMGAQGHGFIHRLFIGSTSLQQVVAEKHPVLLLRPDHPD